MFLLIPRRPQRSVYFENDFHIPWIQTDSFIYFDIKKNFMAPFYGWGSTVSRLQPLRGGSLLFTIQFPELSGTHFIDLGRMNG